MCVTVHLNIEDYCDRKENKMSSDYYAVSAWIMTWDDIKKAAPKAAAWFEQELGRITVDTFCYEWYMDNFESFEKSETATETWRIFHEKFQKETKVGKSVLKLAPTWRSDDCLSRYDDDVLKEHSSFFLVDNVEQFTPAAKKHKKNLRYVAWVDYG
jgi:hypothetical protein